jgi:hypothetical protein
VFYTHDDEHLNLTIDPKTGQVVKAAEEAGADKPAAEQSAAK